MEFKIDKEAIEQAVTNAIIESSIGEEIQKAISGALTATVGDYHNRKPMLQAAVESVVTRQVDVIIRQTLMDREGEIRTLVAEKLSDEMIHTLINASWGAVEAKLKELGRY